MALENFGHLRFFWVNKRLSDKKFKATSNLEKKERPKWYKLIL